MNYAALQTEIQAGPLAAECVDKSDSDIAVVLNAQTFTKRVMVPIADLQAYIYTQGTIWWDVQAAAASEIHPGYMAARAVVDLMGARFTNLDFTFPRVQAVLGGLVLTGILTETQRSDLEGMSYTPASRAEIIGLGTISAGDVSRALRGPW